MTSIKNIIDKKFHGVRNGDELQLFYTVFDSEHDRDIAIPLPYRLYSGVQVTAAYRLNDQIMVVGVNFGTMRDYYHLFRLQKQTFLEMNHQDKPFKTINISNDGTEIRADNGRQTFMKNSNFLPVDYAPGDLCEVMPITDAPAKKKNSYVMKVRYDLTVPVKLDTPEDVKSALERYIRYVRGRAIDKNDANFQMVLKAAMEKMPAYNTPIDEIDHLLLARARKKFEEFLVLAEIKDGTDLARISEKLNELQASFEKRNSSENKRAIYSYEYARQKLYELMKKQKHQPGDTVLRQKIQELQIVVDKLKSEKFSLHRP